MVAAFATARLKILPEDCFNGKFLALQAKSLQIFAFIYNWGWNLDSATHSSLVPLAKIIQLKFELFSQSDLPPSTIICFITLKIGSEVKKNWEHEKVIDAVSEFFEWLDE